MTGRADIHRPSNLDPAEYAFVAAFYQGTSEAMFDAYSSDHAEYDKVVEWIHPDYRSKRMVGSARKDGMRVFDGNFAAKNTCDHCGAHFAHGVLFLHTPTGDLIHVGHICASDTIGLPSKAAATRKRAEKAAREEAERVKRHAANEKFRTENGDVVDWLTELSGSPDGPGHPFLNDMVRTYHRWGNLSPRQTEAVRKWMAAEERRKNAPPEPGPDGPLVEGTREVTGEVLSVKWQDSYYGGSLKMLVKEPDGNKVWGTVPSSLNVERGDTVSFTATVERSRDDENFGFFKRPRKAKVTTKERA